MVSPKILGGGGLDEYTVVGVIIAIVTLIATVTTPIVKLNNTMSRLTALLDDSRQDIKDNEIKNRESHQDMYKKITKNTTDIVGVKGRLNNLEGK